MRFHWFAEVTYPHLPADFRERYGSAWVTPPAHLIDPQKAGETYKMFIRLMQLADKVGFDGLTVNEHHQTPLAMSPSPNLLAASLASTTRYAAIMIVGNSLALYNPPTRVAEEYAYLDCLSGGRLAAGFVLGTPMDSVFCLREAPDRDARTVRGSAPADPPRLERTRAIRLQRQVQPAALREYLAAPGAEEISQSGCRAAAAASRPGTWSSSTTTATAICRSPGCTPRSRWSTGSGNTSASMAAPPIRIGWRSPKSSAWPIPTPRRRKNTTGGSLLPSQLRARQFWQPARIYDRSGRSRFMAELLSAGT